MALEERKLFIKDKAANMSTEDKNMQLSAELTGASVRRRKIVSIQRVEIGGSGWWVWYRAGKP